MQVVRMPSPELTGKVRARKPTPEQLNDDGRADGVASVRARDFHREHERRIRELRCTIGKHWHDSWTTCAGGIMESIPVIGRRGAETIGPFRSCGEAARFVGGQATNISKSCSEGINAYGYAWKKVPK